MLIVCNAFVTVSGTCMLKGKDNLIWKTVSDLISIFFLKVETCKDRIASALETLRPTTSWERTTTAGQGLDGVLIGGRGFGMAMEALCNYLGSEYGNTFALGLNEQIQNLQFMTFVSVFL